MSSEQSIELHHTVVYPHQSAKDVVGQQVALSAKQIQTCFAHGAAWLETNGKPKRFYDPDQVLKPRQKIHFYCNPTTLAPCPYIAQLIEDLEGFSIWFKPAGMLSQGSKWGDHWSLHRWIRQHHWPDRDCLITHRLDRYTEGLMIVAHDDTINRQFHRLFEQRQINKTYRAVVSGVLSEASARTLDTSIENKSAITQMKVLKLDEKNKRSLLELKPETGRKHQIRVHLQHIGHPVINDRLYGESPYSGDLMLQASGLSFKHPVTGEALQFDVPPEKKLTL